MNKKLLSFTIVVSILPMFATASLPLKPEVLLKGRAVKIDARVEANVKIASTTNARILKLEDKRDDERAKLASTTANKIGKIEDRIENNKARLASTTARMEVKAEKKAKLDEKRQAEVKKLLDQTMRNYTKLIAQIENLAQRTATREGIMFDKGTLSPQEKASVDAKLAIANDMIAKVKIEVSDLANLSVTLVVSDKPGQEVKALRQASNKVKSDIQVAHKAVNQAIELIKSSYAKERRSATSTPEKRSEDDKQQ